MTDWMGWHFSDTTECLRYGDGRKIAVGVTHTVDCRPALCESGMHASKYVRDALKYAPGPILWRVSLSGHVVHGDDKSCATVRTYHARIDATDILRAFARKCALDVIHLWSAPSVVREYLGTGNEELRAAAASAASEAWSAAAEAWSAASAAAEAWSAASAAEALRRDAAAAAAAAASAAAAAAEARSAAASAAAAAAEAAWASAAAVRGYQRDTLEKMVTDAMGLAS